MNHILAIDPGTHQSGYVFFRDGKPEDCGVAPNSDLRGIILGHLGPVVIEMIASYGMAVGKEVFETCLWIGRFIECTDNENYRLIYRKDVKMHLCGTAKAKDANVRQALIDKFGGQDKAIGKKASQGPLYAVKSHAWAALAVAVTASETP